MNNQFSIEVEKHKSEINKWYQFYVGLDIGADFHVAACIPFEKFRSEKGMETAKDNEVLL